MKVRIACDVMFFNAPGLGTQKETPSVVVEVLSHESCHSFGSGHHVKIKMEEVSELSILIIVI